MLNENIVIGAENALADRHRNKLTTTERVGNQKARALGDVKNILHSHSSSTVDRSKGKKSSNFVANTPMKSTVPVFTEDSSFRHCQLEVKNPVENTGLDEFEIHDHSLCEKALDSFIGDDLILKHRFTKQEIEFFGRNFIRLKTPMLNFTPFEDNVCDIEIEEKNYYEEDYSYNILDDLDPVSVPPPIPFY